MCAGKRFAWWLSMLMWAVAPAIAQTMGVLQVESRVGVKVPVFASWRPDAVATLVLFSGGGGGYGRIGDDGWPTSSNFLIRSGKLWAEHPFNLVMVGRPSDGLDLKDGAVRTGDAHGADNRAVLQAVKARSDAPLWLVGTSMGTISATAAVIRDTEGLVAGVVLTSSVTAYRKRGAVPTQELGRIRVPVLVVHHARDACAVCQPHEVRFIMAGLNQSAHKELIMIDAGGGEAGDPCEPMHFHGFIGAERETVDRVARWISNPRTR